jgi:hypothetical protein
MPMEYGSWAIPLRNQQYRLRCHSFIFICICQTATNPSPEGRGICSKTFSIQNQPGHADGINPHRDVTPAALFHPMGMWWKDTAPLSTASEYPIAVTKNHGDRDTDTGTIKRSACVLESFFERRRCREIVYCAKRIADGHAMAPCRNGYREQDFPKERHLNRGL